MALNRDWSIGQLDIQNAFLHGILNEVVYMKEPPAFIDRHFPDPLCLLHKSIYGLRQAPRTCFDGFSGPLFELGFIRSRTDTSIFLHYASHGLTLLLLYVDDILITGANSDFRSSLLSPLHNRFEVKDFGTLHSFLGIEVHRNDVQSLG